MSGQEQQALSHCKCLLEMGNLAWSQLQLCLLPEPLPGSELAGSLVEWGKQSLVEPPSVRQALLAKLGVFVLLTWETDHAHQRPELIKATVLNPCLEPLPLLEEKKPAPNQSHQNVYSSTSRTWQIKTTAVFITHGTAK